MSRRQRIGRTIPQTQTPQRRTEQTSSKRQNISTRVATNNRQTSRPATTQNTAQKSLQQVPNFPIDLVYTWVDGSDEELINLRKQFEAHIHNIPTDSASECRWRDLDELKYSIESAYRFAPWIRRIYIITDHQRPYWFDENNPGKLVFVDHPDLFGDFDEHLPTFNSHSIETHLHRVPGLSEHFIYANDDTFFGNVVSPNDFFTPDGKFKVFLSTFEMPTGKITDEMIPYAAAQLNTNNLLTEAKIGRPPRHKLKHQMKPLRRSVFEYCWNHDLLMLYMFNTSSNRFRDFNDIDPAALVSHVGLQLGSAIPDTIQSKYYVLNDDSDLNQLFKHLYRWRPLPKLYCINDNMSNPHQKRIEKIHRGFEKYLPHRYLK